MAGPGGEKKLPAKDRHSTFHIDGELTVTDKPVIKKPGSPAYTPPESSGQLQESFPDASGTLLGQAVLQWHATPHKLQHSGLPT